MNITSRAPHFTYTYRCYTNASRRELAWAREHKNLVTTSGSNDLLETYFKNGATAAAWYLGLVSSVGFSAYNAADTMASHAGWTEAGATNAPDYTGNRPALTFGAAAGGVLATSAAASFTFTQAGTVKGGFAVTVATKDGTTGVLYSVGNFTGGDAPIGIGYVLDVSVSISQT